MLRRICICALLVFPAGCEFPKQTSDLDIKSVKLGEVRQMLYGTGGWRKKSPTILVDIRSTSQYAKGHIPSSINIPIMELVSAHPRLSDAYNIVVYASGWRDALSGAAYKKLISLGYENVYDFRGGLEVWEAHGLKVDGRAEK